MARSVVTVVDLLKYNTAYDITPDAVDLANDHSIDLSNIKDDLFMVMIENTSTGAYSATVSFLASSFNSESGQGNLDITIGDGEIKVITLESARFKGSDGLLLIDIASGDTFNGRIFASELPR